MNSFRITPSELKLLLFAAERYDRDGVFITVSVDRSPPADQTIQGSPVLKAVLQNGDEINMVLSQSSRVGTT